MNIKVHQTASNGAYVLSTPARFSAASAKLRRLCARAVALTHRGNTVTTTSTARSHRAESFQPTGLSALAPVEIRKTRAFAKALAWLIASVTAVGALTFALHSAHSNEGTRKFALSVFALGAGGLAALTAHLSVTWILISCALTAPRHSSRRTFALKALRLWSPRAARLAVVALGISATALSLGDPTRALADAAPTPPSVTATPHASDSGERDNPVEAIGNSEGIPLSDVTTLGWAPREAGSGIIPSLEATAEPTPSQSMAYSGASQALPAPAAAPNAIEKEIASPAPTAARTATAPRSSDTYTVKQGDTLWTIAKRHLTSLNGERPTNGAIVREIERIAALNPEIDDVDLIFPGQIFNL